jgi:hypothetical protein
MTIRTTLMAAALVTLAGFGAAAQETKSGAFDETKFPPEVRASLQYAYDECRDAEGGKVTFAPDTVRTLDLTGDGRPDYIVDFKDTTCEERESLYCGTGGCGLDILVALPDGTLRTVFSMRVRQYDILPARGARRRPTTIRFALHGTYCGRSGNPSCIKRHTITDQPFEFEEPQ